jgi:hypothetical protein
MAILKWQMVEEESSRQILKAQTRWGVRRDGAASGLLMEWKLASLLGEEWCKHVEKHWPLLTSAQPKKQCSCPIP